MLKSLSYPPPVPGASAAHHNEALLGLVEAELACLRHRRIDAARGAAVRALDGQIRDAIAARCVLLRLRRKNRAAD
jgi:ribosomal protein L16/L10AE